MHGGVFSISSLPTHTDCPIYGIGYSFIDYE